VSKTLLKAPVSSQRILLQRWHHTWREIICLTVDLPKTGQKSGHLLLSSWNTSNVYSTVREQGDPSVLHCLYGSCNDECLFDLLVQNRKVFNIKHVAFIVQAYAEPPSDKKCRGSRRGPWSMKHVTELAVRLFRAPNKTFRNIFYSPPSISPSNGASDHQVN
jgi:hypothetical protein